MTITIPILGVILMLMVLSTILEHLINWGYRKFEGGKGVVVGFHIIKWLLILIILNYILK
jgi:hypothetical protein